MPLFLLISSSLFAQVGINTDNSAPDPSAMLDVKSINTGILVPRMLSTNRTSISSPATGLLVYQTDAPAGFYYYNGTQWVELDYPGTTFDCEDYDGNAYPTLIIGTQEWMGENLRVTHYRNGTDIPNVTGNAAWAVLTTGAYCWYNNDPAANAKYGIIYNWYAVNSGNNLCPTGWHEPSDAEWAMLTTSLGGENVAGGKMKSVSALWNSPNTDATNNSGFSCLPGGYRNTNGNFYAIGLSGYWWTATAFNSTDAWFRHLYYSDSGVTRSSYDKKIGYSVRCLRD